MKLEQLLNGVKIKEIIGDTNLDVVDVKSNSNYVGKGSLFVAHKGIDYDGKNFIKQVEMYGGIAIVCQSQLETHLTQIIVEDTRKAIGQILANFYLNVHKKMRFIGVVGTNGKTTTTHMIYNALKEEGKKCGLIGTLGCYYDDKFYPSTLTTPDPIELYKTFYDMCVAGVEYVVMEVSAHAIYWQKVFGIDFEVAVFNIRYVGRNPFFRTEECGVFFAFQELFAVGCAELEEIHFFRFFRRFRGENHLIKHPLSTVFHRFRFFFRRFFYGAFLFYGRFRNRFFYGCNRFFYCGFLALAGAEGHQDHSGQKHHQ